MGENYVAPAFNTAVETSSFESAVAQFVGVIAVLLAWFGGAWAWCYFVCRGYGGLQSCNVGWFTAKATCRR